MKPWYQSRTIGVALAIVALAVLDKYDIVPDATVDALNAPLLAMAVAFLRLGAGTPIGAKPKP